MIVPTHRSWYRDDDPRPEWESVAELAAAHRAPLVVLCSGAADPFHAPSTLFKERGAEAFVVDLARGVSRLPTLLTDSFPEARRHRNGDLSAKRNAGLLIGLLCGWDTWLFRDDDIQPCLRHTGAADGGGTLDPDGVAFAVQALRRPGGPLAVGWRELGSDSRSADDNSVVGHARRAAGLEQGVFVGGGALAVRRHLTLPFFPDVYNEDWLFMLALGFGHRGSGRAVADGGAVRQAAYDPFRVERARAEEFGDILAEGLFGLMHHRDMDVVMEVAARTDFWQQALQHRVEMVVRLRADFLARAQSGSPELRELAGRIAASLSGSLEVAQTLAPQAFVGYLQAWRADLQHWNVTTAALLAQHPEPLPVPEAVEVLGLRVVPP